MSCIKISCKVHKWSSASTTCLLKSFRFPNSSLRLNPTRATVANKTLKNSPILEGQTLWFISWSLLFNLQLSWDSFNTQMNFISDCLIHFNKDVLFSLLLFNWRWLRRWWRWSFFRLLVAHKNLHTIQICCCIVLRKMLAYIYNRKRLVKKKSAWVDACWSCVNSC